MAAKLNLLSLSEIQKLGQSSEQMSANQQEGLGSEAPDGQWAWNPKVVRASEELDDSWEVRAFAEDYTGSVRGSTWPPRCYTCTFCKREFRSAQALGGHMNVHRRDRASKRFNHPLPPPSPAIAVATSAAAATSSTSDSTLIIPARDLAKLNGGFCLLYQLPPQSNAATPGNRFSTSPIDNNNIIAKPGTSKIAPSHQSYSSKTEASSSAEFNNSRSINCANRSYSWNNDFVEGDLDLELRLGQNPSA